MNMTAPTLAMMTFTVISMYFHPHSTHSTPPPDTLGALWYHPSDHPQFTSLCHLPDILVSNPHLNSLDLSTSGPRDLQTSESQSLIGTSGPSLLQFCLHYSIPFNTFCFPFRNHCMYIFCFPFRCSFTRPLTQVLGTIQSQGLLSYPLCFRPLLFIGHPLDSLSVLPYIPVLWLRCTSVQNRLELPPLRF